MSVFQPLDPLLDRWRWKSGGLSACPPHPPLVQALSQVCQGSSYSLTSQRTWLASQAMLKPGGHRFLSEDIVSAHGWQMAHQRLADSDLLWWICLGCWKASNRRLAMYHGTVLSHPWKGDSVSPCKSFMQLAVLSLLAGQSPLPDIPEDDCFGWAHLPSLFQIN